MPATAIVKGFDVVEDLSLAAALVGTIKPPKHSVFSVATKLSAIELS
jgi:hypothetical protein